MNLTKLGFSKGNDKLIDALLKNKGLRMPLAKMLGQNMSGALHKDPALYKKVGDMIKKLSK